MTQDPTLHQAVGTPDNPGPARTRRGVLVAGVSGLAGLVLGAFGRPSRAEAAAGSPLVMGSTSNSAGTSDTSLTTASAGTALLVTQTGAGTALRGSATAPNGIAGFFTSANGAGVSGVTANKDKHGVYAGHDAAATGIGAALRAQGAHNSAVVATTSGLSAPAVVARHTGVSPDNTSQPAILALASNGARTDIHPGGSYQRAAGEFAGPVGVIGAAESSSSGVGVIGLGGSTVGVGVAGVGSGYGVSAASDTGYGVRATTQATTTGFAAVQGLGFGSTGTTFGVHGLTASSTGTGTYGGASSLSGVTYGLYGFAYPNGWALFVDGRANITGNLNVAGSVAKASGTFRIDHPLDPANKYLQHSFVESPDMLNVYSGTVTLDATGQASVAMPDWFEALNRDIRYQLTAVGAAMPDLHVKARLEKGAFAIGGGKPGADVSWLITGIRHDAWANAHRVQVEVAKTGAEKGRYLHPAEHGKPASAGMPAGHAVPDMAALRGQGPRFGQF